MEKKSYKFSEHTYLQKLEDDLSKSEIELADINKSIKSIEVCNPDGSINNENYNIYSDLINRADCLESHIYDIKCELQPKVYMCQYVGSDRYPFELVKRNSEKVWWVRMMEFKETGCYSGHCYDYASNPKNDIIEIRQHKNGRWYEKGQNHCPYHLVEEPYAYIDPSF